MMMDTQIGDIDRETARRQQACTEFCHIYGALQKKYGRELAWGELVSFVGFVLLEQPQVFLVRAACRFLGKRIILSTCKRLTGYPRAR
jgi:hypothetical protein